MEIEVTRRLSLDQLVVAPFEQGTIHLREIQDMKFELEQQCRDDPDAWTDLTKKLERFSGKVHAHVCQVLVGQKLNCSHKGSCNLLHQAPESLVSLIDTAIVISMTMHTNNCRSTWCLNSLTVTRCSPAAVGL